jgi:hypothetical protein
MGGKGSRETVGGIEEELEKLDLAQLRKLVHHLLSHVPDANLTALEWFKGRQERKGGKTSAGSGVIDGELAGEYWDNARPIISKFNEYGGGPNEDEEEAYGWLDKVQQLAEKGDLPSEIRMGLADDVLEEYFPRNSGFDDALMDIVFALCREKDDWIYLIKRLREHPSRWHDKLILEIEKDHLRDDRAYLDLRKKTLQYGLDYWDLAGYYIGKNDMENALKTSEEGILKGEGRIEEMLVFLFEHYAKKKDPGELERIVQTSITRGTDERMMLDRLFRYYKARGDYESAKRAALRACDHIHGGYFEEYRRLKDFLSGSDWKAIENRILQDSKKKDLDGFLDICLSRGEKKTVMKTILRPPKDRWGMPQDCDYDRFARRIGPDFPKEMAEYFWRRASYFISMKGRDSYRAAAAYLSASKDIYLNRLKDPDGWTRRFERLKAGLRNRPAFLDEARGL